VFTLLEARVSSEMIINHLPTPRIVDTSEAINANSGRIAAAVCPPNTSSAHSTIFCTRDEQLSRQKIDELLRASHSFTLFKVCCISELRRKLLMGQPETEHLGQNLSGVCVYFVWFAPNVNSKKRLVGNSSFKPVHIQKQANHWREHLDKADPVGALTILALELVLVPLHEGMYTRKYRHVTRSTAVRPASPHALTVRPRTAAAPSPRSTRHLRS